MPTTLPGPADARKCKSGISLHLNIKFCELVRKNWSNAEVCWSKDLVRVLWKWKRFINKKEPLIYWVISLYSSLWNLPNEDRKSSLGMKGGLGGEVLSYVFLFEQWQCHNCLAAPTRYHFLSCTSNKYWTDPTKSPSWICLLDWDKSNGYYFSDATSNISLWGMPNDSCLEVSIKFLCIRVKNN